MADNLSIDRRTSALLVMDDGEADHPGAHGGVTGDLCGRRLPSRYPEVSDRNATFNRLKASGAFAVGAENTRIHPAVAPLAEEIVVTKHRVSAFAGTDLDLMLRANGIETLILMGIATSGVVLSTLRHAADADYRLLIVGDCCSDGDEEAHRVLLEKVIPRQATITSAAGVAQAIGAGR
jgi:nicotinamidase-related amidase